ncbi:response regulator protein TmoT [Duganella phyllosphaerae]|uniref:Response regulator protein TmoT n=2 Tax=Duganella phyllosphaerae TaxID=762836 RepID=A0A1E7X4X1_9BURK|nr:response regulator protein TmoT [Duganella phyllosphaerae]
MQQIVYVVDDDESVRQSFVNLLDSEGYQVHAYDSAAAFFAQPLAAVPACLLLDMRMPEVGGFDVAAELERMGADLPIIFITGHGSIPLTVQAMKAGALEFLTKPVEPDDLLRAVRDALVVAAARQVQRQELDELRRRHATLTPREREAMQLVIGGLLIKQIANDLGISEIMAKTHKRNLMDKMHARSLPDLVRYAERLNITQTRSR